MFCGFIIWLGLKGKKWQLKSKQKFLGTIGRNYGGTVSGEVLQFFYRDNSVKIVITESRSNAGRNVSFMASPAYISIFCELEPIQENDNQEIRKNELKDLIEKVKLLGIQSGEITDYFIELRYGVRDFSPATSASFIKVLSEVLPFFSQIKECL